MFEVVYPRELGVDCKPDAFKTGKTRKEHRAENGAKMKRPKMKSKRDNTKLTVSELNDLIHPKNSKFKPGFAMEKYYGSKNAS